MLAQRLRDAGFECELLAAEPGRPNLIADLAGESSGETLCLLGHVDTVPADASEWSFDPGRATSSTGGPRPRRPGHEGPGRGRGRRGDRARARGLAPGGGALKVVVTADEEMGAALGAQWLCEEHPEAVRSDLVVNEGGGAVVRARRPALLHPLRRREGRLPLPAARPRARRARLGPGARRQRPAEARAGARPARATSRRWSRPRRARVPRGRCSASELDGAEAASSRARSSACAASRRRSPPTSPSRCCG